MQRNNVLFPHHGVLNENSTTTKLRVVLDASCKSSNGKCLNEFLLPGPKLQHDLTDVLFRFRTFKYVICADVSKMFRQIQLDNSEKSLHRILWRFNKEESIKIYELQTVTYGTTGAFYVSIKCMQQLAIKEGDKFPIGPRVVLNDFYVDDMLTGANSREELEEIRSQTTELLKLGKFPLHKWASNCPEVFKNEHDKVNANPNNFDDTATLKTLGIQWDNIHDMLQYSIPDIGTKQRCTRRTIKSCIAQIFDPLGLIGPIVVTAKIIIQKL